MFYYKSWISYLFYYEYSFKCTFDDEIINIKAYPLENIQAEKLETIISRGVANTRPRDFYDVYILYKLKKDSVDFNILKKAITETFKRRSSQEKLKDYLTILESLKNDKTQYD